MPVKVHGKYLTLFRNFSEAWDPDDWWQTASQNPYRSELAKAIAGMHSNIIDTGDAEQLVSSIVIGQFIDQKHMSITDPRQRRAELCRDLIDYVESLPREYDLFVELPAFPDWWSDTEIRIADDVTVVRPTESANTNFSDAAKVGQALAAAHGITPRRAPPVLKISVCGYGDFAPEAPAVSQAVSLAKQLAYLLRAYGIANTWSPGGAANFRWSCRADGKFRNGLPPRSLSKMFSSLGISEDDLKISIPSEGLLLGGGFRTAGTAEEKNEAVQAKLLAISNVLAVRNSADYHTIAAAMEWYQDSSIADNQTVAFISACIGIEALIGTTDQEGQMSDRLADRYAFLIGRNRNERSSLREEFRDLLTLRGKLVHGRQPRLQAGQRDKLYRLQSILDQLIRKELDSMMKS